jgi:transcription antitermination factor NusG
MPVLPLEPFLFPGDLLDRPVTAFEEGARWWVLHTRPRTEKALSRRLLSNSIPFFLPLCPRQWRSRGRLLCSHLPLFPSYVFLHGDPQARLAALQTKLVAHCLDVVDQDRMNTDLAAVYRMMTSGRPFTPEERLQPGMAVQITSGPLAGLEGTVIRRRNGLRFLVAVNFLHRGASVEIEEWMITPLDREVRAHA